MAPHDETDADSDFEKLLQDFINTRIEGEEDEPEEVPQSSRISLTEEEQIANKVMSETIRKEMQEHPLSATDSVEQTSMSDILQEAKQAAEEQGNQPVLGSEESELAQAFINFQTSVSKLAEDNLGKPFNSSFDAELLYPNYKPSIGRIISQNMVEGWLLLSQMFPQSVGEFPLTAKDEEFLNFAETLSDQYLQLAVISYVEIMIDMEGCEISYQEKLLRFREKHVKKILYEEYLARKERQRRFTDAVAKKNFPIDADRLIANYLRVAQKDFDGAYKALTTNPAVFAPIDFAKIKPRFFGLVKVTPKDGIRMNIKIGNFMKTLKA
ncbi:MAG: hypothetical protein IJ852_06840 [Alphaproteobacteria bacterium]|nr:hypothetical protein [Alphaproteobacteria bacterium]